MRTLFHKSRFGIPGRIALAVAAVAAMASSVCASSITVPAGLAPGSTYRLVFVTDETYTAADSAIGDYNTLVNNDANAVAALAALGTTWTIIGSTPTVNAITNIGQDAGIPIYNLDGLEVADDATTSSGGLFSGSLINSINFDENGSILNTIVWTGTGSSGVANGFSLGGAFPTYGASAPPYASSPDWIQFSQNVNATDYSLYAISGELTVPSSGTPEPATAGMVSLGVVLLFLEARRRRRITGR